MAVDQAVEAQRRVPPNSGTDITTYGRVYQGRFELANRTYTGGLIFRSTIISECGVVHYRRVFPRDGTYEDVPFGVLRLGDRVFGHYLQGDDQSIVYLSWGANGMIYTSNTALLAFADAGCYPS